MIKEKRGISGVITVVLLILISIILATIIIGFVVPFVRDTLDREKACYEVKDQLKINTESAYTCFYTNAGGSKVVSVTISREFGEVEITGFKMGVYGDDAGVFDIKEGVQVTGVQMINGSTTLSLPEKGGERTYNITTTLTSIDEVKIVPVTKKSDSGKEYVCDKAENTAKIKVCR